MYALLFPKQSSATLILQRSENVAACYGYNDGGSY